MADAVFRGGAVIDAGDILEAFVLAAYLEENGELQHGGVPTAVVSANLQPNFLFSSSRCCACFSGLTPRSLRRFTTFHLTAGRAAAWGNPIASKSGSPSWRVSRKCRSGAFSLPLMSSIKRRRFLKVLDGNMHLGHAFEFPREWHLQRL